MNQKRNCQGDRGGEEELKVKAPHGKGMDEKSLVKPVRKICLLLVLPN